jgi:uncharacterized protein (TIGR00730 family)
MTPQQGQYNRDMIQALCVFCGSSSGRNPVYQQTAERLGELLAKRDISLIYGGGKVGLMGVLADTCLAKGGRVVGVIPQILVDKEVAHAGLTQLHVVSSMHQRKALMADLADAFLALPGGFGTWEEFFEVLTWSQLELQRKACALLNVEGYYDPLLALADRAVRDGFLRSANRDLIVADTDLERILQRVSEHPAPPAHKGPDRNPR